MHHVSSNMIKFLEIHILLTTLCNVDVAHASSKHKTFHGDVCTHVLSWCRTSSFASVVLNQPSRYREKIFSDSILVRVVFNGTFQSFGCKVI